MTGRTVITAVCLAYMLILFGVIVVRFCKAEKKEKFKQLKNFKKGKFALIYFAAIPLYCMGHSYNGVEPFGGALLQAIKSCVDLVVLKYDYSSVSKLMHADPFFCVTTVVCFVLVALNAVLFLLSLSFQSLANRLRLCYVKRRAKKIYAFVGATENNFATAKTVEKEEGACLFLADLSKTEKEALFATGKAYVDFKEKQKLDETLKKLFKHFKGRKINVVIRTDDDAKNLLLTAQACTLVRELGNLEEEADEESGVSVYAFGGAEHRSAFLRFEEASWGRVRFLSEEALVATEFIENYPLTRYMTENHLDKENGLIANGTELHIALVGFGRMNREIFFSSVSDNQFLTREKDGSLAHKAVHYHVFDKNDPKKNEELQYSYMRFENEEEWHTGGEYLPMPPKPCDEHFHKCDVNDERFYPLLREGICNTGTPYVYAIVACGDDFLNLSTGRKLSRKFREWGVSAARVFVRIADEKLYKLVQSEYAEEVCAFGCVKRTTCDIRRVVDEEMERMAKRSHLTYMMENHTDKSAKQVRALARNSWYKKLTQFQRDSNVFACRALRTKLQLLGFDYRKRMGAGEDASGKFEEKYTRNDPIRYTEKKVDGRACIKRGNADFEKDSVRRAFAEQEHLRWNAYMLCNGMVPSDIRQIATDARGKRFDCRRHGNLTTFEGLKEYRKLITEHYGGTEEENDVIRYDYRLMDNVVWLLHESGYDIVEKETEE